MTDIKRLAELAKECVDRKIDFADVSPNQYHTTRDRLAREYIEDANPTTILSLIEQIEALSAELESIRKKAGLKTCIAHSPCEMWEDGYCARCHAEAYP